jgi:integrase
VLKLKDEFIVEGPLEKFDEWLETNTDLLPRTKKQYRKVIMQFLKQHDDSVALKDMNRFLNEKKISFYRFPFKFFLKSLDRENEYTGLIKIRKKPRARHGIYTTQEKIMDLINKILDPVYKTAALIQFYTGARPQDVLSLNKKDFEIKENGIVIYFGRWKGMKEHTSKIPFPEANCIIYFMNNWSKQFPFLKGKGSDKNLIKWIDNNYRYYLNEITLAAKEVSGLENFRPHDFRRNLAADIYSGTKDLFLTKEILGHKNIDTTTKYLAEIQGEDSSREMVERFRRVKKE